MEIYRGDIFYIRKGGFNSVGSEQESGRPGLVVSNDMNNKYSGNVEVVYLTTQPKKDLPTHVSLVGKQLSTALCEGIYTVSVERIGDFIRTATDEEMERVDQALVESIGLNYLLGNSAPATEKVVEVPKVVEVEREVDNSEIIRLTAQVETYKNMYESLLNKVVSA